MTHVTFVVLSCWSLLLCLPEGKAENGASGTLVKSGRETLPVGWMLSAQISEDTVRIGGTVRVTVALVNETPDTIALHWGDPLNPLVDIRVLDADGQDVRYMSISCGDATPGKVIYVAPNESYSENHGWRIDARELENPVGEYSIVPYLRGDRFYRGEGEPVVVTVVRGEARKTSGD